MDDERLSDDEIRLFIESYEMTGNGHLKTPRLAREVLALRALCREVTPIVLLDGVTWSDDGTWNCDHCGLQMTLPNKDDHTASCLIARLRAAGERVDDR